MKMKLFSLVRLFRTPWTVAHQAPPSTGFSRQEYWRGLPFPSPGYLLDPGMEPWSPALQADTLSSEPPGTRVVTYRSYKICVGSLYRKLQISEEEAKNLNKGINISCSCI